MSPPVALSSRIRLTAPLLINVNGLTGSDTPGTGLPTAPFQTPGYAIAWAATNLDVAGFGVTIAVDRLLSGGADVPYSLNPMDGNNGVISLRDLVGGAPTSWTDPNAPIICGSVNGVPIADSAWGSGNPGPLISATGNAVCGVGGSTVWLIKNMQLAATGSEVEADRGQKINVARIIGGGFGGQQANIKLCANAGGNIELIPGNGTIPPGYYYSNSPGSYLAYAAYGSGVIGGGNMIVNPGCASAKVNDATSYII